MTHDKVTRTDGAEQLDIRAKNSKLDTPDAQEARHATGNEMAVCEDARTNVATVRCPLNRMTTA